MQGLLLVSGRLGDVGTFAGSDLALLETFARHVATSLDRGRLETDLRRVIELQEELRHAAMHDPLTELPNRTLFLDRTEHDLHLAGRNGQWPAVLYIDLDGFKPVNDTYGHQAGDLLLKVFSQRLHGCVRTADTAARLGGDEFAVLLHGPIDDEGVRDGARPDPRRAGPAVDLGGGRSAKVGASIGVAFSGPDTDIDGLIRRADLAMYTAKRNGRGISVFYDPALEAQRRDARRSRRPADVQAAHSFLRHPVPVTSQIQVGAAASTAGLTSGEAAARRRRGEGNDSVTGISRSYARILRTNVFSLYNTILFVIGGALLAMGRYNDALISVGHRRAQRGDQRRAGDPRQAAARPAPAARARPGRRGPGRPGHRRRPGGGGARGRRPRAAGRPGRGRRAGAGRRRRRGRVPAHRGVGGAAPARRARTCSRAATASAGPGCSWPGTWAPPATPTG